MRMLLKQPGFTLMTVLIPAVALLVADIASASFPMYARNLNAGENSLTGTVHRKAKVTIHRSAEFPSFVELNSVTRVDR
jgi:hypothetical protein